MFRRASKRSSTSQHSGLRSNSSSHHPTSSSLHQHQHHRTYHLPPEHEDIVNANTFPPPPPSDRDAAPFELYPTLSEDSSNAVPDSIWFCHDFILGAGTVIIQPATSLIVLIYQPTTRSWFLPKGRKDTGESLEQTALREAYEESGYRAKFLPLALPSLAPLAPTDRKTQAEQPNSNLNPNPNPTSPSHSRSFSQSRGPSSSSSASARRRPPLDLNTEPIYITTQCLSRRRNGTLYQYLTFWYVAFIEEDATRNENTGNADEMDYESYLVTYEEAMRRLKGAQRVVVDRAYRWWRDTERWTEEELVESVRRMGEDSGEQVEEEE